MIADVGKISVNSGEYITSSLLLLTPSVPLNLNDKFFLKMALETHIFKTYKTCTLMVLPQDRPNIYKALRNIYMCSRNFPYLTQCS